jgi:hypothetical protein
MAAPRRHLRRLCSLFALALAVTVVPGRSRMVSMLGSLSYRTGNDPDNRAVED